MSTTSFDLPAHFESSPLLENEFQISWVLYKGYTGLFTMHRGGVSPPVPNP